MANPVDLPIIPVALQGVAAPGYSAIDLRRLASASHREGAVETGDLVVSQRAAGPGLAVDVAAGQALVQGDSVVFQGAYHCALAAALTGGSEVTVTGGDATNPRIDQVVLEVLDTQYDGSGSNKARVRVIAGTPTAGATLDNRFGAAALPSSAIRLADLLMPAGSATATTANIRDRRPRVRGARGRVTRFANAAAGNDYTTASATFVAIDGTNLILALECNGVDPVRIRMVGHVYNSAIANIDVGLQIDGATIDGGALQGVTIPGVGYRQAVTVDWEIVAPAAGRHLFRPTWLTSAGLAGLNAQATRPCQLTAAEEVSS